MTNLLKKLFLDPSHKEKYRSRLQGLEKKYGQDFSGVLGTSKDHRLSGLDEKQDLPEKLRHIRERAAELARKKKWKDANLYLDLIEGVISDTFGGFSLEKFGRSQPLDREAIANKIESNMEALESECSHLPPEMREEVAYCWALLQDSGEMLRLLGPLDKELGQTETDDHALTGALRKKEEKHCFPDIKVLPVGILSSETFQGMTSWGWQAKDPGPGASHGDNTHRLQWYALMTRFEEDCESGKPWKYTPFELFTMIGDLDSQMPEGNKSIWFKLMDQPGGTGYMMDHKKANPQNMLLGECFVQPDGMNHTLCTIGEVGNSPLGRVLKKRYDKRHFAIWGTDGAKETSTVWKKIEQRQKVLKQELLNIIERNSFPELQEELDEFLEKNGEYFKPEKVAEFQPQDETEPTRLDRYHKLANDPHTFQKIMVVAINAYMKEYAQGKQGYERPLEGEELLVGGGKDKDMVSMSSEEKKEFVKNLRKESRMKFDLPVN
ncbi:MAG: hypothetical protein JNK76_21330 [Planctomycetales bacterium]|nr:hypothetical protein [Planctomycetales bacterium]MBN8626371.1 hypothetical protein [Planctomycetota bacterium]